MLEVNKKLIKECADNLLFDLSDEETERLLVEFGRFKKQIDFLHHIDGIEDEPMMAYPIDIHQTYLREDKPETPLKVSGALKNVNNKFADQVKVSRVIGEK